MSVFEVLQTMNLNVNSVLDIGANIGDFSKKISLLYPDAYVLMIEANEYCEPYLKMSGKDYIITALSDDIKEVNFYINSSDPVCTGNSYYKEISLSFKEPIVKKIVTERLDDLVQREFDFLKIDTQGSELDILKGGLNVLNNSKYVLLECSTIKEKVYNEGAPHIDDIFDFMKGQGFDTYHLVEEHVWNSSFDLISYDIGEVFQKDYLFMRN